MPIRLNRFEMPKGLKKIEETATDTYAKYVAEPFEIGYARTIGNSLRRVLLSSIEGVAITSVKIKGVDHEFSTIPGVMEDVADIIINLKKVLLKAYTREPGTVTISAKGPGVLTAAAIHSDGGLIEVVNPDQVIATLADDGEIEMELELELGRGFHQVNVDEIEDEEIGKIAIDALHSPVTRVNFSTSMTRVGQRTDYDKLELEIWTDGRVSPDYALTSAAAILRHHMDVFVGYDYEIIEEEEVEEAVDTEFEEMRAKMNMSVNEIELSVRAENCLNNANITTVGELVQKTEADMLKYRNFGKKSLNEIKDKLLEMGLNLGMNVDPALLNNNNSSANEDQGE